MQFLWSACSLKSAEMTQGWVWNNWQPYFWLLAKKVEKKVAKSCKKVAKNCTQTCSSLETLPASFRGSKSGGTGWQIRGSAPTEEGCVIRMMSKASSAQDGKKIFYKKQRTWGGTMNERSQMQGGKNWIWEIDANRFFWDSHWLEIWTNHFCPSMGPNGESVTMDSDAGVLKKLSLAGWAKLSRLSYSWL